jgi:hypothetical protein
LDGAGNFTVTEYQFGNTGTQALNGGGTYTVGTNCTLNLSFTKPAAGTPGAFSPPTSFASLIGTNGTNGNNNNSTNASTGLIVLQPSNGQVISGVIISQ